MSTLRRGLLKVLAKSLGPLHIVQESQVRELYEGFSEKFRSTYKYKALRSALGDVLDISAKGALSESSPSSDMYDDDMKIATINKEDLVKYIVNRIRTSPHVVFKIIIIYYIIIYLLLSNMLLLFLYYLFFIYYYICYY